jgi:oligosaccharide repeat unit polymerase
MTGVQGMRQSPEVTVFATFLLILLCYFCSLWVSIPIRAGAFLLSTYAVVWCFRGLGAFNPLVWYPPFLLAYMSLYSLVAGGVRLWGDTAVLEEVISVGLLALAGFFFGAAVPCYKRLRHLEIDFNLSAVKFVAIALIIFCLLIAIYSALFIEGIEKQSIKEAAGAISVFFPLYTFLAVIVNVYLYQKYQYRKINLGLLLRDRILIAAGLTLVFNYSVSGERESLFYMLVLFFLLYWTVKANLRPYKILLLVAAVMFLAPITQYMKLFLRQDVSLQGALLHYSLLQNEFASAGRNTFFVLSNFDGAYMNGKTILWSIMRYFDFIFPDAHSAGAWFNTEFRSLHGSTGNSGWGFSFAAEGYINFGHLGIFIFFAVKGLFISAIYRLSDRGPGFFLFYLLTIPTLIYVIRGDLASLLALSFKYNLLFAVTFFLFHNLISTRRARLA